MSTSDRVNTAVADPPARRRKRPETALAALPTRGRYEEEADVGDGRQSPARDRVRRILNVLVAAFGLVICAPLMLVIAFLVKVTSPGPVLYTHLRVGARSRGRTKAARVVQSARDPRWRLFVIYKFRTMEVDADREGQTWAAPDDPRVTPLGRLLRNYRLDELPQLVNVLKGEMNLVGPRPEQPDIFERLSRNVERYVERQQVLPGITGWAQVNHHYDQTVDDVRTKLRFDLEYLERRCAKEDLKIMLRTIPVVFLRRGAW